MIVISPCIVGSSVSNSTTSTTSVSGTSLTNRPWNVSVCALVLPAVVGSSYVSEIRNVPPSRASNAWTWLVIPSGTIHCWTASASSRARYTAARGARMCRDNRVTPTSGG